MTAPTKTTQTALMAWQSVSNSASYNGSALDVSGIHVASVSFSMGRANGTAHTTPYAVLELLGNTSASDNNPWVPIAPPLIMPAGGSIANTTLNGSVSAAATSIIVTSASNIAVGDILFLGHTTDATKYEIARVVAVSGTTITLASPLLFAHDSGATVTDQAEQMIIPCVDLSGIMRIKARLSNNSGQSVNGAMFAGTVVF